MMRFVTLMLLSLSLLSLSHAQHPFYKQLLDQGNAAMTMKKWDLADRYLEIAAFGLMEDNDALATAYMRLVIVNKAMENDGKVLEYVAKVNRVMRAGIKKPATLSAAHWEEYQVIAGLKAPPPPPLPKNAKDLEAFLRLNPDRLDAWLALVEADKSARATKKRSRFETALEAHPKSKELLERALDFAAREDRGRGAKDHAEALLKLEASNPLANEVLGNIAAKAKDYDKAVAYYDKAGRLRLSESTSLEKKTRDALEKEKEQKAREEERAKKAEEARQAKLREDEEKEAEKARLAKAREDAKKKAADAREAKRQEEARAAEEERDSKAREEAKKKREAEAIAEARKKAEAERLKKKEEEDAKRRTASTKATRAEAEPKVKVPTERERLRDLEKAVDSNPLKLDLKYDLLDAYLKGNKLNKARKVMKEIAKKDGTSQRYAGTFAHYTYLKRKYSTNIEYLEKLTNRNDKANFYLGMSYYRAGSYENAYKTLKDLDRKAWPELASVDMDLERQLAKKPEAAKAKKREDASAAKGGDKELRTILRKGSFEERLAKCQELAAQERWFTIRRTVKQLFREEPTNRDVMYLRGRIALNEEDFRRATQIFYELANKGYNKGEVFYYGGLSAHKEKDMPTARYLFGRAKIEGTEFQEEIDRLLLEERVGTQKIQSQKITRKIKELESMTENANLPDLQLSLMRLYVVSGNKSGYERLKNEMKQSTLTSTQRDLQLAWNLIHFGHEDQIFNMLSKANNKEAQFIIGFLYYRQGNKNQAQKYLETLRNDELFPEVRSILTNL